MSKRREQRPIDRIAPDDLPEQVDADVETVDGAVNYLHRFGPSSTPREQRRRCPKCGTVRIGPITGDPEQYKGHDAEYDYRCANSHLFDDPAPPLADADGGFDLGDLDGFDGADDETDPFEWVSADDLEAVPVRRRLAQLDDRSLTALAIVLYAPWNHTDADPSYRDLGDLFPYSRDWVGERVRAWRDGEFRDLVADPRPWGRDE
jgi:hypothetical protein